MITKSRFASNLNLKNNNLVYLRTNLWHSLCGPALLSETCVKIFDLERKEKERKEKKCAVPPALLIVRKLKEFPADEFT